ncbi:hypothetical protein DW095_00220 [Bacteroides sp. AM07-16]|nr:hypothetical protein DW095_00220 [Bacteroides sp. AM07-16]
MFIEECFMGKLRIIVVCCFLFVAYVRSQPSFLLKELRSLGFENLSSGNGKTYDWFAFEDRVHRNTYQGLGDAVQLLLDDRSIERDVAFILLENNIPQIKAVVPYKLVLSCRNGLISIQDVFKGMAITYDTDNYRQGGEKGLTYNHSAGKIDLVFYPQLLLANYRLDVLYVVALDLAPAVKMQLWPGAKFTGQVIFPLYNNLKGQVDYIRPGILALSQSFRLHDNVFGSLSAGNFNANRMGVDASLRYRTNNGRFSIGVNAGVTGSSTFYDHRWQVSNWNRMNYFGMVSYYEPHYNMEFDLQAGQYIYGDKGIRMDCTRHFGEVSVGVFAMYVGDLVNGGFNFAISLPGRKRRRPKHFPVRFMLPEYFDWEYQAQASPEYQERRLGQVYEVRPDENHSSRFYNPDYIKYNLIHFQR